jgi:hypothetical protein
MSPFSVSASYAKGQMATTNLWVQRQISKPSGNGSVIMVVGETVPHMKGFRAMSSLMPESKTTRPFRCAHHAYGEHQTMRWARSVPCELPVS